MNENYDMTYFSKSKYGFPWHLPLFRISLTIFQIPWQFPDLEKKIPWLFPDVWQPCPWWSFLLADGAHHKEPHSPTHPKDEQGSNWRSHRWDDKHVRCTRINLLSPCTLTLYQKAREVHSEVNIEPNATPWRTYRWVSPRNTWLQCVSNGVTSFLH